MGAEDKRIKLASEKVWGVRCAIELVEKVASAKIVPEKGWMGRMLDWLGPKKSPMLRLCTAWCTPPLHFSWTVPVLVQTARCTMCTSHLILCTLHPTQRCMKLDFTHSLHTGKWKKTAHWFIDIRQETIFKCNSGQCCYWKKQLAAAVLLLELDFNFV